MGPKTLESPCFVMRWVRHGQAGERVGNGRLLSNRSRNSPGSACHQLMHHRPRGTQLGGPSSARRRHPAAGRSRVRRSTGMTIAQLGSGAPEGDELITWFIVLTPAHDRRNSLVAHSYDRDLDLHLKRIQKRSRTLISNDQEPHVPAVGLSRRECDDSSWFSCSRRRGSAPYRPPRRRSWRSITDDEPDGRRNGPRQLVPAEIAVLL